MEEHTPQEVAVDLHPRGPRVDVDPHLDLLRIGKGRHQRQHLLEEPLRVHPFGADEDAVGLELHEEQDVVDQRVQVPRAAEHAVEEARVLVAHRTANAFAHERRVAEYRVQRRAKLVGHHAEELGLHAVRAAELVGQSGDAVLARAQRLVLGEGDTAGEPELGLELAAERLDGLAAARGAERLSDDFGHERERVAAGERLRRRGDGVQDDRAARVTTHRERQDEKALVGELGGRDGDEAAVGHVPEADGLDGGADEACEHEPAALVEVTGAAAEALRLRREAGQRELATGPIGKHDGTGLDGQLAHEYLGDLLPADPEPVAACQHAEHQLDGREVEDRVVPLLLHLRQGATRALVGHPALRPPRARTCRAHRLPRVRRSRRPTAPASRRVPPRARARPRPRDGAVARRRPSPRRAGS